MDYVISEKLYFGVAGKLKNVFIIMDCQTIA